MSVKVAVLGASGYTGAEVIRLLAHHPRATISHLTADRHAGKPVAEIFPHLRGLTPLLCHTLEPAEVAAQSDLVFCCLPHGTAMQVVPQLLGEGLRVIDLSADFRLRNAQTFEGWYNTPHGAPELLAEAVYGLVELNRERIGNARLVAVPGCYPTSVQLALAPLLAKGLIDTGMVVIDSKSGVSGAGRNPSQSTHFVEASDGISAYKVTGHRHIPEMEQELSRLAGRGVTVRFTPHLSPHNRGILTTAYVRPETLLNAPQWRELYQKFYHGEPFVEILPEGSYPATAHVRGSNRCQIALAPDVRSGWLVVLAAIDNLVKGAAGQAVQCMNLMLGCDETTALQGFPLFP